MACMGPSQDHSFARGEKAYREVLELLKEKYQAERPVNILNTGFGERMQEDWDRDAEKLREALRELIWTSDAASW